MKRRGTGKEISSATIARMPRYYRYMTDLRNAGRESISSAELSSLLNVTASQIRQDFNCFGGFGQQGVGYNVPYLCRKIGEILGVDCGYRAVIIGAGNLGRALASSTLFEKRGVSVSAIFDVDPEVIGREFSGFHVLDMRGFEAWCAKNKTDIAVLTVPRSEAANTAKRIAGTGIKGIWNFTNTELKLSSSGIHVQNIHMGDTLMILCYHLSAKDKN